MKGKVIKYLVIVAVMFCTSYFLYHRYTGGFSLENIKYDWPGSHAWELPSPEAGELQVIKKIVDQPYHFFGYGNQTYVFASEDGQYVIKLFRFGHLKPPLWFKFTPDIPPFSTLRRNKHESQQKRLYKLFKGHWLAYQYDRERSGLVYVHLNPTDCLHSTLPLIDRLGMKTELNLDSAIFVIQKKATVARTLLEQSLSQGNVKETKSTIDGIFDLYMSEYKQGIYDRDHNVVDNVGFCSGQSIRIDVGKLLKDDAMMLPENSVLDLQEKVCKRLNAWIKRHYPQYHEEFSEYLDSKIIEWGQGME